MVRHGHRDRVAAGDLDGSLDISGREVILGGRPRSRQIDVDRAALDCGRSLNPLPSGPSGLGGDVVSSLLRMHLTAEVDGGFELGDVIGGYGVAHACLASAVSWGQIPADTTVAIQGVGTMGGAAAYYLYEAGMKVTTLADAAGTLHCADGLDVPALLDLRDGFGEIDRTRLPAGVEQLPRTAILSAEVDILVPAAISYAITPDNSYDVRARVVVEAANAATTPEAEAMLAARGVPVLPDFVANAGAVAWAWWLLLGEVDDDPQNSFDRLRTVMHAKVAQLLAAWTEDGVTPRETGHRWADDPAPTTGPVVIP